MNNPDANGKEIRFQVLGSTDLEDVIAFAESRLRDSMPNEVERTFFSWQAKWRRESLEHYLKLGWSFIARVDQEVVGFFLAQPFMFFRGQTQTVWVEHVEATNPEVRRALLNVAVRVGREKHMQRVLFADSKILKDDLSAWQPMPLSDDICEVKTTKG